MKDEEVPLRFLVAVKVVLECGSTSDSKIMRNLLYNDGWRIR